MCTCAEIKIYIYFAKLIYNLLRVREKLVCECRDRDQRRHYLVQLVVYFLFFSSIRERLRAQELGQLSQSRQHLDCLLVCVLICPSPVSVCLSSAPRARACVCVLCQCVLYPQLRTRYLDTSTSIAASGFSPLSRNSGLDVVLGRRSLQLAT